MLSSITQQLAEQISPLPTEVKAFQNTKARRRRNPTNDEWLSLLECICGHFQTVYVFIDALVLSHHLLSLFGSAG